MVSGFFGFTDPQYPVAAEAIYREYFSKVFGPEFYQSVLAGGSDVYVKQETGLAVDFKDQDHHFTLSIIPGGWQLIILDEGKLFEGENVSPIEYGNPQDMMLLFHALKSKMIINLEDSRHKRLQKQAEDEDRKNNFMPEFLPGTSMPTADWELQLIHAGISAGHTADRAIYNAKRVIWLQIKNRHAFPGSLTVFTERKPSVDPNNNGVSN